MSADRFGALLGAHGGVLTTAQARQAGVTKSELSWARRKGLVHPLRSGVFTEVWETASPVFRHELVILAQQRVHPDLVASGASAATLWELPTPQGPPGQPLLTAVRLSIEDGARGRRGAAVTRRARLTPAEIGTLPSGARLTSPLRTVLDCAREWEQPWGLAIADAALGSGAVEPGELIAAAGARAPAPGVVHARWAATHARLAVESPLESLARAALVLAGLPEPIPQVWVSTRQGEFRVDLADEVNRVITEADRKLKYTDQEVLWREKRREDALRSAGFEVVRFTMADHHTPAPFLRRYAEALAKGQHRCGP